MNNQTLEKLRQMRLFGMHDAFKTSLENTIKEKMDLYVENAELQVKKGNKAAGARARKIALELMKDLKEFRKVSVAEAKK